MSELLASVVELNTVLSQSKFLQPYDFRVLTCALGECAMLLPFKQELERPGGIVSGMSLMGAADVAFWLAIMTLRGCEEHWVTSDMKTAFLRSAREEDVICTAKVLKLGKKTVYGTAECSNGNTDLLTHHVLSSTRVDTAV